MLKAKGIELGLAGEEVAAVEADVANVGEDAECVAAGRRGVGSAHSGSQSSVNMGERQEVTARRAKSLRRRRRQEQREWSKEAATRGLPRRFVVDQRRERDRLRTGRLRRRRRRRRRRGGAEAVEPSGDEAAFGRGAEDGDGLERFRETGRAWGRERERAEVCQHGRLAGRGK